MTDLPAPPPPRDPDDVASDVVDGLLPPHEAEMAQRDPAVAERVQRIMQVRAALRDIPPAQPQAANQAIAAALDAADIAAAPGPTAPAPPPPLQSVPSPAPLPAARPARSDRGPGRWLAAAAVLVVALVTIGLLARGSDESGDQAAVESSADRADQSEESESEPGASQSGGNADTRAPSDQESPTAAEDDAGAGGGDGRTAGITYLGDVPDAEELAGRVDSSLTAGAGVPAEAPDEGATASESEACPSLTVAGDTDRGTATFVADATLDGNPVRVHVYQSGDEQRLVATDQSCTDVVDQPFDG
jgi:hypothetical protein